MVDSTKPLVTERNGVNLSFAEEIKVLTDYLSAAGFCIEDDQNYLIYKSGTTVAIKSLTDGVVTLTDLRNHQARHITGGAEEIDGDKLDIDWNPTYYTPAITPTEADSADNLTAHLYGIDQEINTTANEIRFIIAMGKRGKHKKKYLDVFEGIESSDNPYVLPFAATLEEIVIRIKKNKSPKFEFRKNGTNEHTVTLTAEKEKIDTAVSEAFVQGDELSIYIDDTDTAENAVVWCHFVKG